VALRLLARRNEAPAWSIEEIEQLIEEIVAARVASTLFNRAGHDASVHCAQCTDVPLMPANIRAIDGVGRIDLTHGRGERAGTG
jgi:hypothetical protein